MEWYYTTGDGQQVGPVVESEIQNMFSQGIIKPSDMVWQEGMAEWTPISQVPQLSGYAPSTSAPSATPVTPAQQPAVQQAPLPPPQETYGGGPAGEQPIPTYLSWSVVVLLLCFWPTAIPAIIAASNVNKAIERGDIAAAKAASAKAKKWCWISFGIGFVWITLAAIGAVAEAM